MLTSIYISLLTTNIHATVLPQSKVSRGFLISRLVVLSTLSKNLHRTLHQKIFFFTWQNNVPLLVLIDHVLSNSLVAFDFDGKLTCTNNYAISRVKILSSSAFSSPDCVLSISEYHLWIRIMTVRTLMLILLFKYLGPFRWLLARFWRFLVVSMVLGRFRSF